MKKYDPNQMKFVTGLLSVSILITAIGCAAQHPTHSFTELQKRLKRGNTIYVVDTNGTVTSGKFVEASDDALTLNVAGLRQQIDRAQVRQVD
ncbi:MAG TPA: hypothetical protein VK210_04755, partial [Terriglobia bacterium]|nr:hypothetical protein [Terriglobia bacterium]